MNKNTFKFKVGIIGLGYVGLPRSLQFCEKGISVCGIDVDSSKIKNLKKSKSYLTNIKNNRLKKIIQKKIFFPTNDFSYISKVENIIFCLPTPLTNSNKPDLSYIKNTFKKIKKFLKPHQMICLESTSYPGTTNEIFVNFIKKKFVIGKNFYVGFSPERNDPGLKLKISKIPKIVSGYTHNCLNKAYKLYKPIFNKIIKTENLETAEMTKIYENIFRAVNIGFVNEMKKICMSMKINIHDVISSAKTKPFGFMPFYPGPGLGGHCIPIDPFYLSWKANQLGLKTKFIQTSGKINHSMPGWIIKNINQYFFHKKKNKNNLNKKKFLILGISYKKNINDMRESPSLEIIDNLLKYGSKVSFFDPFFKKIPKTRKYNFKHLTRSNLSKSDLAKFDGVILVTDHDNVNYNKIFNHSKVIFDTRNKYKIKSSKIIQL